MTVAYFSQFYVQISPDPTDPTKQHVSVKHGPDGLYSGGIVMEVAIGIDAVSQSQNKGNPLPEPIIVKALVDTGCTITSIDRSIVSALNLMVRGYSQTFTANGSAQVSNHLVSIDFPGIGLRGKPVHQVQAVDLTGQPFQMLVGRDLMAAWAITYNGPAGFVSIAD